MEQGSGQNKNESVFNKYTNWVVGGLLVIAVVVYFIVSSQSGTNPEDDSTDENGEQTQNGTSPTPTPTPSKTPTPGSDSDDNGVAPGNVSATGTLLVSDNASRGNLMVDSNRGKIYIGTQRDFYSLIGKKVTLQADGSINSFKFLGFAEAVAPAPTPGSDMGGAPDAESEVLVNGNLRVSDNTAKGNYVIVSNVGNVYLKTAHNYSAWVGSDVRLKAYGSLASFTGAIVTKK
jgi:hypothetical protein